MRRLLQKWRARRTAREQAKLEGWLYLRAWMKDHGSHCYICGCWHQFGAHRTIRTV